MTVPSFTFATFPAGNFPAADWDTNWTQTLALTNIYCTASGTNSIQLTPATTSPRPSAYQNGMKFTFIASGTNTGQVTIAFGSLASLQVYDQTGVAINAPGAVGSGTYYEAVYDSSLNSNAGGFRLQGGLTFGATYTMVTTAGNYTVLSSDVTILMNKTVGAATSIIAPTSSSRNQAITVKDYKGDAATNNITFVPQTGETIDGFTASQAVTNGLAVINTNNAKRTWAPLTSGGWYVLWFLLLFVQTAGAQGLISAGQFWGNPNSFSSTPSGASGNAMLNQAFCNTSTAIIYNTGGTWGCQTTFPYSQISGTPTAVDQTFTTPGAVTTLTLTNTPLPTAKIQVNVQFDGVVQHPSTWSLSGAVITFNTTIPTNTQEVYVKWGAPSVAVGVNSIGTLTGTVNLGIGLTAITGASNSVASQGPVTINVKLPPYNAKDDCSTDNTTAFQNAITDAAAAGGPGVIYIPPVTTGGGCYKVGAINATKKDHITIRGNGDQSLIKPIASSATNHIWWDLSGSSQVLFDSFKVAFDGSTVPAILFLVAGVNGYAGDVVSGVQFNRVSIDAQSSTTHVYVYGANTIQGGTTTGAGGFSCSDSVWYQRKNAASLNANPSLRLSVISMNGINTASVASDYQTLTVVNPGNQGANFFNCHFVDYPSGFGSGTPDNNTSFIAVNSSVIVFTRGSIQCVCDTDSVFYTNNEGFTFNNTQFTASDGSVTVNYWHRFGGGINGSFTFNGVFWSVPLVFFFGWDDIPVSGACPGPTCATVPIQHFNVFSPDAGGGSVAFMQTTFACASPHAVTWMANSKIELQDNINTIQVCGNIDSHTIIQNPAGGTPVVPVGSVDHSQKF